METITLNNGIKMPKKIFGTWRMWYRQDGGCGPTMEALNAGCRAIDTAQAYRTESGVGNAIKDSGINRKDIFLSTKFEPDSVWDKATAEKAFDESLKNLGVDYIDVMYIHAPMSWDRKQKHDNVAIYKVLEEKIKKGKLKGIGLSNFSLEEVTELMKNVKSKPQVMQIQLSAGCKNDDLVDFCSKNNIQVIPYSPLASGYLLRNSYFKAFCGFIGKEPVDVALSYVTQKYGTCLFGSENPKHIKSSFNVGEILSQKEIDYLDKNADKIGDQNMWNYREDDFRKSPIPTSASGPIYSL